jgi:ankyrin repeat protein
MSKISKITNERINYIRLFCKEQSNDSIRHFIAPNDFANDEIRQQYLDIILDESISLRYYYMIEYILINGANPNKNYNKTYSDGSCIYPLISHLIESDYEYANDVDNFETLEEMELFLKDTKTLELLIKYGADVNKPREDGFTPLDTAIMMHHKHATKLLKKHGAKYSKRFIDEKYPSYFPKKDHSNEEYIITVWIDKTLPPLHREIRRIYNNLKSFNEDLGLGFLSKKINVNLDNPNEKDYLGRTAVDYAIELNHHLAVDYLRSVGGKTSKELEDENKE